MANPTQFPLSKYYHPFWIAGIALGIGFALMVLGVILQGAGMEVSENFAWMAAGSAIMLFAIFNSIFSLFAKDPLKNLGTIILFLHCPFDNDRTIGLGIFGQFHSRSRLFYLIFMVLSIAYLIFMSMVNVMKQIVEFAMKEEAASEDQEQRAEIIQHKRKTPYEDFYHSCRTI
ncbi:MAG: hypothetical protein R2784_17930 [Saprospiraceae bacterium]